MRPDPKKAETTDALAVFFLLLGSGHTKADRQFW